LLRLFQAFLLAASLGGPAQAAPANYPQLETPMPAPNSGPVLSAVDLFKQTAPSIYLIMAAKDDAAFRSRKGLYEGSAVAITQNLALTNCHIVKGRSKLVLIQKKQKDTATVVASDPRTDRCIIQTEHMQLRPIVGIRAYRDLAVGEKVYTIGNPSGLTSTLSEGSSRGCAPSAAYAMCRPRRRSRPARRVAGCSTSAATCSASPASRSRMPRI
jgi:serine protease Do